MPDSLSNLGGKIFTSKSIKRSKSKKRRSILLSGLVLSFFSLWLIFLNKTIIRFKGSFHP